MTEGYVENVTEAWTSCPRLSGHEETEEPANKTGSHVGAATHTHDTQLYLDTCEDHTIQKSAMCKKWLQQKVKKQQR